MSRDLANAVQLSRMDQLRQDLDRLWESFFDERPRRRGRGIKEWHPFIDVSETRDEVIVKAELPGTDPKDIDVSIAHGCLSIRGEKKEETDESGQGFRIRERRYGSFFRIIPLPDEVDQDNVRASFQDGVLKIALPKIGDARRKEIKIALDKDHLTS